MTDVTRIENGARAARQNALQQAIVQEIAAVCAASPAPSPPPMQIRVLLQPLGAAHPVVSLGADDTVSSASTIKTLILYAALQRVAQGALTLTQPIMLAPQQILDDTKVFIPARGAYNTAYTLEELLMWMIVRSDNTATNAVIDLLGMDAVNETARVLGLQSTALRRKMLDFAALEQGRDNTTSAADQYRLYAALYAGFCAGAAASADVTATASPDAGKDIAASKKNCGAARANMGEVDAADSVNIAKNANSTGITDDAIRANNAASARGADDASSADNAASAALLPPALRGKAREILCAQRDGDVLLRYLWQPVRVAHKTGELATVRHDAGVFETQRPYFLAVLITEAADIAAAERLAGRIGELAFGAYG